MALFKRRRKPEQFEDDDDRSFAVALRLEIVAKRMAAINEELAARVMDKGDDPPEGGASE